MEIRELRIRYELFSAMGNRIIHAVVCRFDTLKVNADKIADAGYRIVGIDERYRDEKEFVELDEGWKEIAKV